MNTIEVERPQIKSKKRVTDHAEVFTAPREVNAMLDLVKNETERIESRFLEPACGDGNFLVEILERKLVVVKKRYRRNRPDYERYAVVAVSSIYGVELLEDNAIECRNRLFKIFKREYKSNCGRDINNDCLEAIKYILSRNILCGDALTLLNSDKNPIIFSEWSLISGRLIKRRDFELSELVNGRGDRPFSENMEYDPETDSFIPTPIREYPLTDYRRIQYADQPQ